MYTKTILRLEYETTIEDRWYNIRFRDQGKGLRPYWIRWGQLELGNRYPKYTPTMKIKDLPRQHLQIILQEIRDKIR